MATSARAVSTAAPATPAVPAGIAGEPPLPQVASMHRKGPDHGDSTTWSTSDDARWTAGNEPCGAAPPTRATAVTATSPSRHCHRMENRVRTPPKGSLRSRPQVWAPAAGLLTLRAQTATSWTNPR